MNKIVWLTFLFFALVPLSVYSEICELKSFNLLESYLTPQTLLILDIDDTLIIPKQMLGCDEWFLKRMEHYLTSGRNHENALENTLAEWEAIRHLTEMRIVEPGTEKLISKLQMADTSIMALTTQGLSLATRTTIQLKQLGFNLAKTCPSKNDCYISIDGHGVLSRGGILFTSGTDKGKSLFTFLDTIGYVPSRIVFVNDKYSHLVPVEIVSEERGIPFLGLRYSYADKHKSIFSQKIADIQFECSSFTHILSDEEALNKITSSAPQQQ